MTRTDSNLAKAFWVAAPGRGEIRSETLSPAPGLAIVQALYSGVSRGTESLVFRGRVPASERSRMRAPHQAGEFPGPVKYGYASVGRVVEGPESLRGREVFCLFPHQTRYAVDPAALTALPPGVPAARAVLAANLETAVNGVWDAGILPGDRVGVIGAGTVGCLVAWLASRIAGCEVQLVDVNPSRARIAAALGLQFGAPADAWRDCDRVLHASASAAGLALALEVAASEATVTELSWYGEGDVAMALGGAFHSRRLRIASSQVGEVAGSQRGRWTHARRLAFALRLLAAPELDVLITSEGTLDELPATMALLASAPGDALVHRVRY